MLCKLNPNASRLQGQLLRLSAGCTAEHTEFGRQYSLQNIDSFPDIAYICLAHGASFDVLSCAIPQRLYVGQEWLGDVLLCGG